MSFKNAKIGNIKCRIMRISFTGEHSYEINVQANYGRALWEKCMEEGKEFNITPYGTETMHLLRAEKGFIIVGQDTDGTMTPIDLQMDWIISKKKYDHSELKKWRDTLKFFDFTISWEDGDFFSLTLKYENKGFGMGQYI